MSGKNREDYFETGHLDANIGQRTMRGGAITAVAQVVKALVEIVATVVLARLLLPSDFGLVGMVISVTGFLAMFKDLGLSMATIQREHIDHAQVSTLFWINLGFSALIMLITVGFAPVLAWFFEEPRLLWVTMGLAGAFIFGGLTVQHEALLRRQMRFGAIAIIQSVAMVISVLVAIGLAWQGWSYWALVARAVVSAAVTAVGVWIACSWRPGLWSRAKDLKALLGFGGNLTGFNFVNYFARNLDDILIGRLYGTSPLGFYQKAYEILMVPLSLINSPVSSVAIPALSRLAQEPVRYREAYLRIMEKVLMIAIPLGALLITTSDWVVFVVLGDQWAEAARIFAVLGISVFSQIMGNSTGWLFITQNRTRDMLIWSFIGSGTAIGSFLIGLPWGPFGVALSYSVVGLTIRTPLLLWFVSRSGPVRLKDFFRMAWPFALQTVVLLLVLFGFRAIWPYGSAIGGLAVSIALTGLTAFSVLMALPQGRAALRDAWYVRTLLLRRKAK